MKKILISIAILFTIFIATNAWATNELGWTTAIDDNLADAVSGADSRWVDWKALTDAQSCTTDNFGLQYAIAYKVTGTTSYCDTAFTNDGGCTSVASRDKTRNCFLERALAYSYCADVVSAGNKTTWTSQLDAVVAKVNAVSPYSNHGTRTVDTDELMGHYFGCMVYSLAKNGDVSECVSSFGIPWGGIDATATDKTTLRNAVKYYWTNFSGGTWVEGSEYNKNTIYYALLGTHALNDYYGSDKFPEITTLYDEFADYHYEYSSPDYSVHFAFGDVQSGQIDTHSRFRALATYSTIAHLDSDDANLTHLRNAIADSASNCVRMPWIMFYNHDASASAESGVTYFNSEEAGQSFWHEGWTTNDTFFASQIKKRFFADHDYNGLENMAVWRNDGWAINFPRHYYGNEHNAAGFMNGVLVNSGFASMREASGQVAYEAGSDYVYHSGVSSGFYQNNGTSGNYDSPPWWIKENAVQRLFHNNADGTETIFDYHRVDACRPNSTTCMSAAKLTRLSHGSFGGVSYSKANAASWAHAYVLNTGASPSKAGDLFSWTEDNGDAVELYSHIDGYTNATITMSSQSQNTTPYWFTAQGFSTSEMQDYQLRLSVAPDAGFTLYPMLTAIHIGGSADSYTEVTDAGGSEEVRGLMVENATDRVVFLANAEQDVTTVFTSTLSSSSVTYDSNRFTKASAMQKFKLGGAVTFASDDTKDIDVFIVGLDTSFAWTIQKNGGSAGCTVSANGVCTFTITGAVQTHSVTWSVAGAVTCDDLCSVCSTEPTCDASASTCYWHNNDGTTSDQCNNAPSASSQCVGSPGACPDQTSCEYNGYCWDGDCSESCVVPNSVDVTIYASEDTYLSEALPTTNYDTTGLQVISSTGSGGGITPDFTTYTSGGTNIADVTISSTRVSASGGLLGSEDAYVYKDYDTDNFGEMDVDFTINTQYQGATGLDGFLCFSNTPDINMGEMNSADDGLCLQYGRSFTPDGVRIRDYENTTSASTVITLSGSATTYYGNFNVSGTTATLNMYTDSGRTTHTSGSPQTLTVNDGTTQKYRYLYALVSGGTEGSAGNSQFYVENVTINQEDGATGGGGADKATVLEFDISSLPDDANISNIDLRFVWSSPSGGNSGTLKAYKGLRNFTQDQATWNIYSTGNSWSTAGARNSSTDMVGTYTDGSGALGTYTITGSEFINDVDIFTENNDFVTYAEANLTGSIYIYVQEIPSSNGSLVQMYDVEDSTVLNRPRLDITYTTDNVITPPVLSPKRSINGGTIFGGGPWGG